MILTTPFIDPNASIDFYAGNKRAFRQLKSIYDALEQGRRGTFYASPAVPSDGIPTKRITKNNLEGYSPIVINEYKDLSDIFYMGDDRPFIMYEPEHTTGVRGLTNIVSLFLCKEQRTYEFRRLTNKPVERFDTPDEAVKKLLSFIKGKEPKLITEIEGKTVGLLYMTFGTKALHAAQRSLATLRRLGVIYPAVFVGYENNNWVNGHGSNIEWEGENPFDLDKRYNFRFRAGRIKPFLYDLSPFDYTLYIDADTVFNRAVDYGFKLLSQYDMAVTEETLTLKTLYNKARAGWELNMIERDVTVIELGGNDEQKFINSGVIFFRKSKSTKKLFSEWYKEWSRFQEWDEQLALMRAIHSANPKLIQLPVEWNDPHPHENSYIIHNYGRGTVRQND